MSIYFNGRFGFPEAYALSKGVGVQPATVIRLTAVPLTLNGQYITLAGA